MKLRKEGATCLLLSLSCTTCLPYAVCEHLLISCCVDHGDDINDYLLNVGEDGGGRIIGGMNGGR